MGCKNITALLIPVYDKYSVTLVLTINKAPPVLAHFFKDLLMCQGTGRESVTPVLTICKALFLARFLKRYICVAGTGRRSRESVTLVLTICKALFFRRIVLKRYFCFPGSGRRSRESVTLVLTICEALFSARFFKSVTFVSQVRAGGVGRTLLMSSQYVMRYF